MIEINNRYRYILTDINGQFEGFPLSERSISFEYSKPDNERFDYEFKISGKIQFIKENFQRLLALEQGNNRCGAIEVLIQRNSNGSWVDIATGQINLTNGIWDLDRCIYEAQFEKPSKDAFVKSTEDVDLFKIIPAAGRVSASTIPYDIIPSEIEGYTLESYEHGWSQNNIWVPPAGYESNPLYAYPEKAGYILTDLQEEINYGTPVYDPNDDRIYHCEGQESHQYYSKYNRWVTYISPSTPLPYGAIDLNETRPGDGFKKIARLPQVDNFIDELGSEYNCVAYKRKRRSVIGGGSPSDPGSGITIPNGLQLFDVLTQLLQPYGLTPKSDFFNIRPSNPNNAVINYVTGKKSTTAFVVMFQKSDVKRPEANKKATAFKISLKNLLKWLVNMFNVRYGVSGSNFIIEHVSYFGKGSVLNLTTPQFSRFLRGSRKYTYSVDTLPAKETFSFMEKRFEKDGVNDFTGLPIIYDTGCLTEDAKKQEINYTVDKVTTDIQFIIDNATSDAISDDGFVLAACNKDEEGNFHIMQAGLILSSGRLINNVFGWAHLQNDFWRHDRYATEGNMNAGNTIFFSSKPIKKGNKFVIPKCDIEQFEPNAIITTQLGDGVLESARFSLGAQTLELEISYPETMTPAPIGSVIYAKLFQENTVITPGNASCTLEGGFFKQTFEGTYRDIIVRFFSDPLYTIPYYVKPEDNITVKVKYVSISHIGDESTTYTFTNVDTGGEILIKEGAYVYGWYSPCGEFEAKHTEITYITLEPNSNYTVL